MKTTDAGDVDVLAQAESELRYMNTMGRSKAARIKIPKGHTWRLRFIPFKFPNKMYYARIAFHWINNRPILCLRNTEEGLGGVKDHDCPICRVAQDLNDSSDKKLSNAGYWASSNPQWLAMALPFAKDDGGGEENTRGDERWTPAEFWMHRATALDFIGLYRRDVQRVGPQSFMHFEKGRDLFVTVRQQRGGGSGGMKIDRDDSQPFYRLDDRAKFDEMCERVLASVRWKMNPIPTDEELEEAADKLDESARRAARGRGDDDDDRGGRRRRNQDDTDLDAPRGGGSRAGRGRVDDDDRSGDRRRDPGDDRGSYDDRGGGDGDDSRGSARGSSGRRVSSSRRGDDRGDDRVDDRGDGRDDDRGGGGDDDDRGGRAAAPEPRRGSTDDRRRRASHDEIHDDDERGNQPTRRDPPPSRAAASAPPPSASRRLPPPPAASTNREPARAAQGQATSSLDPDEHVAEEDRDPAPPADGLPQSEDGGADDGGGDLGAGDSGGGELPPPPVRSGGGLSDRLRNSIRRASSAAA